MHRTATPACGDLHGATTDHVLLTLACDVAACQSGSSGFTETGVVADLKQALAFASPPLGGAREAAADLDPESGDSQPQGSVRGWLDSIETGLEVVLGLVRAERSERIKKEHEDLQRLQARERDEKLCVICQDAQKTTLIMPCRHLCVCGKCSSHASLDRCPICRTWIDSTLDVYT